MTAPVAVSSAQWLPCPFTLALSSQRPSCSDNCAVVAPYRLLCKSFSWSPHSLSSPKLIALHRSRRSARNIVACLPSTSVPDSSNLQNSPSAVPATRIFVTGLSFRTNQERLTDAFQKFGQVTDVHLVMDKVVNRPKGFAFIRYATEEEAKRAIEGMHGKFLDGRVVFVEVARPRSEVRQNGKQTSEQF